MKIRKNGMAFMSSYAIQPVQRGNRKAPCQLDLTQLSLIVPVKNNQQGIQRFLLACMDVFSPDYCPREIIVVDNGSSPPLVVPDLASWGLPLQMLVCSRPGPGAARNCGAKFATGEWVLFLDSDCLPTPMLIEGYQRACNGSVAYAGMVCAAQNDPLSRYYETQRVFVPPSVWDEEIERPAYLVTANALVWRPALLQVNGFDEQLSEAGEDVDFGFRLRSIGPLAYAPDARIIHETEPDLGSFFRRFVRYGRASRLLNARYQIDPPRKITPRERAPLFHLFATLQFCALWWGYWMTKPGTRWFTCSGESSSCQEEYK